MLNLSKIFDFHNIPKNNSFINFPNPTHQTFSAANIYKIKKLARLTLKIMCKKSFFFLQS